jgi:hypothetical protein
MGATQQPASVKHRAFDLHARFEKFLRARFWPSLFGSGFVGAALIAVVGPLIVSALQAAPPPTITQQEPPAVTIETLQQYYFSYGINPEGTPRSQLAELGAAITAHLRTSGFTGRRQVRTTCAVFSADAGAVWSGKVPLTYQAANGSQVTPPCFIPLPPLRSSRHYNAVVVTAAPTKQPGQTGLIGVQLVTPFTAPPTVAR